MKPQKETDQVAAAQSFYAKFLIFFIIVLLVSSSLAPFSFRYILAALFAGLINYFFTLLEWKHRTGAWSHIPGFLWNGLSVGILVVSESFAKPICFPQISENSFARWTFGVQFLSLAFAFSTSLLLLFRSKTKQYLAMKNPDLGAQS